MFKQTAALFLIIAFTIQTFSSGFVMLDYYTNTAAFARSCVNKAKPKMHCNGRCQMMKKLKEQEKKDQQVPERKQENKTEPLSSKSFFYSLENHFSTIVSKAVSAEKNFTLTDMAYSFFHPPQV